MRAATCEAGRGVWLYLSALDRSSRPTPATRRFSFSSASMVGASITLSQGVECVRVRWRRRFRNNRCWWLNGVWLVVVEFSADAVRFVTASMLGESAAIIKSNGDVFLIVDDCRVRCSDACDVASDSLDRSSGDIERLRQFFIHSSGVIRSSSVDRPLPFRSGFKSNWAWISLQNTCILYWFRHFSEQNCSWVAPSWKLT